MLVRLAGTSLLALGAMLAAPESALAQSKSISTYSITAPPTTPPATAPAAPVAPAAPPKPVVTTPKPDFTRLGNTTFDTTTTEIPDRPKGRGEPAGGVVPGGNPGNLNQLQSLTSINQLLALPRTSETASPVSVLHRLENRLPTAGQGQSAAGQAPEDRAGALQALDGAKPLL
jgi:hypothetical protein